MTGAPTSVFASGVAPARPSWARMAPALAAGAGVAWIGVAGVLERRPSVTGSVPIGCPVAMLTGLDCPGCGSTRALGALTRFDLLAALDHNVLVPFALVFVVASWVSWARAAWRRPTHRPTHRSPTGTETARTRADTGHSHVASATDIVRRAEVTITVAVVVLVFTVVRNLDVGIWLSSTG